MLRLTTLGALDLRDRLGHPVRDVLAQPKRVALLVYLAVESRRGPVLRDRLLALFWPESDAERARNALSQSLHHLRQALGADVIESTGATSVQLPAQQLWCDAAAFGEALERGEGELALDLYRGDFCAGLFVSGAPDAERWLDEQRARLRTQVIAASRTLAERVLARGDRDGAARVARRALAMHPDDEGEVRALLGLLDRAGDDAGALAAYRTYEERLKAEFDTEPGLATRRLAEAIRQRREAASSVPAVAGAPGADRQAEPAKTATSAGRSRPRILAVAALVVLALLTAGTALLKRGGATTVPVARTVAVFPFTVRGSADLGFLREGMVDLLSAKLDGASGFHAIDPRSSIAAARPDSGAGAAGKLAVIAARLGAGRYISGDVVEIAGRIQINSALYDPATGTRPVATATVSGDTAHLFELVDELTGRMLAGMIPGRDTALTRLAALTTTSLPALKAYLEGERALRAGHDLQAGSAFREAVMLDTAFAIAHYRLAMTATWVAVPGADSLLSGSALTDLARRHGQRATPLVRDLIRAYAAYKLLYMDSAEAAYRRLTATYPDNVEAWFMLAECLFHYSPFQGRPSLLARGAFQRVLALDPNNSHAQLHLGRIAALAGDTLLLDSLVTSYAALHSDAVRTLEMRALQAALHDDPVQWRQVMRDVNGADPVLLASVLQAASVYAGHPALSRDLAAAILGTDASPYLRTQSRRMLSDLPLSLGQLGSNPVAHFLGEEADHPWRLESEALLAANPVIALPRQRIAELRDSVTARGAYPDFPVLGARLPPMGRAMQTYLAGLLSARLGDSAALRRATSELAATTGPAAGGSRALALSLQAEQLRAAGDQRRALTTLQQFFQSTVRLHLGLGHRTVHERFAMAELLREMGRVDEALAFYLSFPAGYDGPWVAVAQLRAAQLLEQQRDSTRARFYYGRALRAWHSADAEYAPLVDQARDGLDRLK